MYPFEKAFVIWEQILIFIIDIDKIIINLF